ncbi:MAG: hypothetical protein GXO55_00765 [Chloroflexi bacterium]|nr:hypothetical protein [Chloroflexota bacterium]
MSGVTFLFLYGLVWSSVALLANRWRRLHALVWMSGALASLWIGARWPEDRPVLVLGREVWLRHPFVWHDLTFRVDAEARHMWWILGLAVLVWSGLAFLLPRWGKGLGWLPLLILTAIPAITVQSVWGVAWGLAIWVLGTTFFTQGGAAGHVHGGWRWSFPLVLAAILGFFLLYPPDPNTAQIPPWQIALTAIILILTTQLFPLHTGLLALTQGSEPIRGAWAWWIHTLVVMVGFIRLGAHAELVQAQWNALDWFQFLAYLTLIWSGVAALTTNNVRRLWGYAALYNWALTFALWIAAPTSRGTWEWTLAVRWLALGIGGFALTTLLSAGETGDLEHLSGWARRRPWSVTAWAISVATLAGVPFTPGFWTQWLVHFHLATASPLSWLALIGGMGVALGLIRALVTLWGPLRDRLLVREGDGESFALIVLSGLLVSGALFPTWLAALGRLLW